jgi:hypothetical protein
MAAAAEVPVFVPDVGLTVLSDPKDAVIEYISDRIVSLMTTTTRTDFSQYRLRPRSRGTPTEYLDL